MKGLRRLLPLFQPLTNQLLRLLVSYGLDIYLVSFCSERDCVKCDPICFVDADRMGCLWFIFVICWSGRNVTQLWVFCCRVLWRKCESSNEEFVASPRVDNEFLTLWNVLKSPRLIGHPMKPLELCCSLIPKFFFQFSVSPDHSS